MPIAWWPRILRGGLCVLVAALLTSCLHHERRSFERLRSAGDLRGAHEVLVRLVTEEGDAVDVAALAELEAELAEEQFQAARHWLEDGMPGQARLDLGRCLLFDPTHIRAHVLVADLVRDHLRHEDWRRHFEDALDSENWERALELLAEPEPVHEQRSYLGRSEEIFRRAEEAWVVRFDLADRSGGGSVLRRLIESRESWHETHADLAARVGVSFDAEREVWERRLERRESLDDTLDRAARAERAGDLATAHHLRRRVLHRSHADPGLKRSLFATRDRLRGELARRLRTAAARGEWTACVRLREELEALGGGDVGGVDDRLDPQHFWEQVHRDALEQLLARAGRFEAEGLPGNAYLVLTEVLHLDPRRDDAVLWRQRLKEQILGVPLVSVRNGLADAHPVAGDAPVVILRGKPVYRERRWSRLKRKEVEYTPSGEEWTSNPVYDAQERRLAESRQTLADLEAQIDGASELGRQHLRRRHELSSKKTERLESRLRALPVRECRSTWERQESIVETRELRAELVVPLVVLEAAGDPVGRELRAAFQESDRCSAADHGRLRPGDPDDLPTPAGARQRLEAELETQLEALYDTLRVRACAELLERSARSFDEGQTSRGVELGVRVLLEETRTPGASRELAHGALETLLERTPHSPEALRRLLPSP